VYIARSSVVISSLLQFNHFPPSFTSPLQHAFNKKYGATKATTWCMCVDLTLSIQASTHPSSRVWSSRFRLSQHLSSHYTGHLMIIDFSFPISTPESISDTNYQHAITLAPVFFWNSEARHRLLLMSIIH
jgi:hypothetical protein